MCLVKEMTGTVNDIGTRQFDTKYLWEIILNRMRHQLSRRRTLQETLQCALK